MKKYLLPETGNFYKANLHCHTTVSDGKMTPQEIKEHYMKNGYSIVAFTDHDVMVTHPELADENFLPLNGYEMEVNEEKDAKGNLVRSERRFGSCSRSFYVGENIKAEDVKAKFDNGVLNITLPSKQQKAIETKQTVTID